MKARVNGIDIAYRLDGPADAPVVMLSHSLATTMAMWRGQVPALAARYRVLSYDMRGHGESAAPKGPYSLDMLADDAAALLDHLKIERAVFVGLSVGGMIGQALALRHPRRLGALVLCNTTSAAPPPMREVWDQRIAQVESGGMVTQVEPTLARWFTEPFRRANPKVMEWVAGMIRGTPVDGFVGCGRAIQQLAFTDRLGGIKAPTLVVAGDSDPGTTVAMAETIRERIPGAELGVIEGASHLSAIEKQDAFNQSLSKFLDRLR
jgi:3-oxoadipate enol-lactonase